MVQTITVSDEAYQRLAAEASRLGLPSVEAFLETWRASTPQEHNQRDVVIQQIDARRERILAEQGTLADSVDLIREDRER